MSSTPKLNRDDVRVIHAMPYAFTKIDELILAYSMYHRANPPGRGDVAITLRKCVSLGLIEEESGKYRLRPELAKIRDQICAEQLNEYEAEEEFEDYLLAITQ